MSHSKTCCGSQREAFNMPWVPRINKGRDRFRYKNSQQQLHHVPGCKGWVSCISSPPRILHTCLTWLLRLLRREGAWTEAEYPGKASAPAGRSCSQPSWVNREPYLPATSTPDTRKISKETNCSPRGRCVYLPCRWASKSMLFVKISVHMWSCDHQGPRGKGNMRSHVTTGPRTGINTPACLLPSSEIRAKHFKIWDFIRWSVLNSNLSLR